MSHVGTVDGVLQQAGTAVGGGDSGGVDAQFAGHGGDDLLAPVTEEVSPGDLVTLDGSGERLPAVLLDPGPGAQLTL